MRACLLPLVTLVALGATTPAFAKTTSLGAKLTSVGGTSIEVAGAMDLMDDGDHIPAVIGTFVQEGSDEDTREEAIIRLSTLGNLIIVSDGMVDALGLEAKTINKGSWGWLLGETAAFKTGGEFKVVNIDRIELGNLVLTDVTAVVGSSKGLGKLPGDWISVGLGALEGVAWSIAPSTGTVTFAPGTAGAELVAKATTRHVATSKGWTLEQFGEDDVLAPAISHAVEATVGGHTGSFALSTVNRGSAISAAVTLEGTATQQTGATKATLSSVQLGDTELGSSWVDGSSSFDRGNLPSVDGFIGMDILAHTDISLDPVTGVIGLSIAAEQSRTDTAAWKIAQAEADLAEAIEEAKEAEEAEEETEATAEEGAEEGAEEDADKPEGNAGVWNGLASAHADDDNLGARVDALANAAAHDEDSCSAWNTLGQAQLAHGDLADAQSSFETAAGLYEGWWGPENRSVRKDHAEATAQAEPSDLMGKINKALIGWSWDPVDEDLTAQDAGCHTVYGHMASLALAEGDTDTAKGLYDDKMDLDTGLAQVASNAALVTGDLDTAHAIVRQAIKLEHTPSALSRLGLAMIYNAQGDWGTARPLFEKSLNIDDGEMIAVSLYLDGTRKAEGGVAALSAAKGWAAARPTSVAALYGLIREAHAAEAPEIASTATADAMAVIGRNLLVAPEDSTLWASKARIESLSGDLEAAAASAEKAIGFDENNELAWIAMADVASASGDTEAATGHIKMAATKAVSNPGYAILLASF
jgi:tetratricopeptide (TPR) repeat protein